MYILKQVLVVALGIGGVILLWNYPKFSERVTYTMLGVLIALAIEHTPTKK